MLIFRNIENLPGQGNFRLLNTQEPLQQDSQSQSQAYQRLNWYLVPPFAGFGAQGWRIASNLNDMTSSMWCIQLRK
ncbi:hypothetical protein OUZ56_006109 [Daphnia magna]|uniref:Uncharacterized protein n=1 Tax=Daphnia magna TaxID=35525 RepID=A0ABQ9YUM8_9CRUS|nr:hypothetical protein OUZ56_006109 [Daphnia magna]